MPYNSAFTGAEIDAALGRANTAQQPPAEGPFVNGDKTKLNGIEVGATADMSAAEIKAAYESNANTNAFTDAEKTKLAGLQDSLFLGTFLSLIALQTAHPSPATGSYAYVDAGASQDISIYVWDATDGQYVQQASGGTETNASIKTKYEANPDTNAFTDALLSKLNGIETGATADQTGAEIVTAINTQLGSTTWQGGGGSGVQNNFSATTNPGVGDDAADGYAVGSRWVNVTTDTEYVCLDATNGAAVWREVLNSASGGTLSPLTAAADDKLFVFKTSNSDAPGPVTVSDALTAAKAVISEPAGVTGADQITNIMSLTSAEYAAIGTPNASTLYIITDA